MAEEKSTSTQSALEQSQSFHTSSPEEALQTLNSSSNGLSVEEAERRLEEYGPNEITAAEKISPLSIFIGQFKNFLMYILLAAVVVSIAIGEVTDAIVILVIVIFAAVLGFFQEYRAEQSIEALKRMVAPKSKVLRAGETLEIESRELVPGDIILMTAGDRVPADSRLLQDIDLRVDEAPLTGESVPVTKKAKLTLDEKAPVADRKNMVFTATTVTYGKGKAVVSTTGEKTEFGKIAEMIKKVKVPPTPLETRMNQVGKWLGILCVVVCAVVGMAGILQGRPIFDMFLLAVALAIAAVPEALPAVVTMSLAVGVKRMVKRNSIVRKLPAVETLGCTSIICSDKTGTLTRGEMNVKKLMADGRIFNVSGEGYTPKGEFFPVESSEQQTAVDPQKNTNLMLLLKTVVLCNDAYLKNKSEEGSSEKEPEGWYIDGDPTEGALIVAAAKAGIQQSSITKEYPRVGEGPFSSERKRMSTVHPKPEGGKVAYVKGAPEVILDRSTQFCEGGEVKPLTKEDRERMLKVYQDMAGDALRVLGMAYKELSEDSDTRAESVEKDLIFLGLMGMIDAPREEAIKAIRLCKQSGIRTVMVTGDHKITAKAIAKELGITNSDKVMTGVEMDEMSEEQFEAVAADVGVYARVDPEHKTRLVKALKNKGYVVAMTGDGVNDAPALKNANIGIAMGISGTEVTKEASDMVLTDDNFASIVAAVEEGRGIYDNIKKYLIYLLSANIGEILVLFIAILLGWPAPLIAIQLLWVNLVTDGLPAIALGIDPADPDIMARSPRDPKESVFKGMKPTLIGIAVVMTVGILVVFNMVVHTEGIIRGQTFAFASLTLFEIIFVLSCRSQKYSLFQIGPLRNKWLIYSVLFGLVLLLAVMYVPALAVLFHCSPLSALDWVYVVAVSVSGFICYEVAKVVMQLVHRRGRKKAVTSTPTASQEVDPMKSSTGIVSQKMEP